MCRAASVLGLIIATVSCSAQMAEANDQAGLEEILSALKGKRHSPTTQSYKIEFDITTYADDGKVRHSSEVSEFQIEWPSGRFRLDGIASGLKNFEQLERYDGEILKSQFRPTDAKSKPAGDWQYGQITGTLRSRIFVAHWWPVFFNRGVIKSSVSQAWYPGHFLFDAPGDQFFLHQKSTPTSLDVIRSFPERPGETNYYEYKIDKEKQFAVIEFTQVIDNHITLKIVTEMKLYGDTWAPASWTATRTWRGQTTEVTKAKVLSFQEFPSAPDSDYNIIPPEGATVGRSDIRSQDGKEGYAITEYEYTVKNGILVQTSGPVERSKWWYWVVAGLVGLCVAVILIKRIRRSAAPSHR